MGALDIGILRELRASCRHQSVIELADLVKLTPQSVATKIEDLQSAGYDIELHPHFGYRLIGTPDRLMVADLTGMLANVKLAKKIFVFEKTESTNDLVARMARDGEPEGLAVFAEEQTVGRGRLGRRWESSAREGLWFSVLLRPLLSRMVWTRLTTWAAVAVAQAIESETAFQTMIKWPNDIYIEGKKVVGILIESHFDREDNGFAVLGIGVNVNQSQFASELANKAQSLRMISGKAFDRQHIAVAILHRLDDLYPTVGKNFQEIVALADEKSFLNGKWISIAVGGSIVEGVAKRLNEQGALVIARPDGSEITVESGEATILMSSQTC